MKDKNNSINKDEQKWSNVNDTKYKKVAILSGTKLSTKFLNWINKK